MEDILRVFSLTHSVITKQVSGENIVKAPELAVKQYPDMSAIFLQIAGMTFEIVTSKDGNKVKNVFIKGEKIDVSREYIFATNNFLASGGDGFEMLKNSQELKQFDSLDKIFAKYIAEISPIIEDSDFKKVA